MNDSTQDNDNRESEEVKLQFEVISAIEQHNCAQVYDIIHRHGISPNFRIDGINPVCKAAHLGFVDILDILVEGGCDVSEPEKERDIWHRRAVHIAASKGHVLFVKRLLSLGVDINSCDDDERTPLHWAATYGNMEMTKYLISEGATVNTTQCDGFTPLHAATCLGHDKVCQVLLKNGAQVDITDHDGWTALHTSVCYGHPAIVKTLLDAGASVTKLTSDQENVLHIAASSGKVNVAKLLVDKGLDINALNKNGSTAFYLAVYYNELGMAKYLIKIGVNMYISSRAGNSPLYLAALRCSFEFISLFILCGHNFSCESWLLKKEFPTELEKIPEICDLLYNLACNPNSLKQLSASMLRHYIKYEDDERFFARLTQSGLPPCLQDFVSYKCMSEIETLQWDHTD